MQRHLLFLALAVLLFSCKNDHTYSYAIKDFRKGLQPYLIKIVEKGIVTGVNDKMITDAELKQLSRSEHPLLRATAFGEMFERESFDQFELLMDHLDDTAFVLVDQGEFGAAYKTVSDHILDRAIWKTRKARSRTVEAVLTKHNYLQSAYRILKDIEATEKYYPFIKKMATSPRRLIEEEGYELAFDDIEYALYGLAKFKKKEDVKLIKQILLSHSGRLSYVSFELMKDFPDTAYLDIFEDYHMHRFYRFTGQRRDGFTGFTPDRAEPEDFIRALVVQQNRRSAQLFDTILTRLALMTCMPGKREIMEELIMSIWTHPVSAYEGLRERIKTKAEEIMKQQGYNQAHIKPFIENQDRVEDRIESPGEIIRWYSW